MIDVAQKVCSELLGMFYECLGVGHGGMTFIYIISVCEIAYEQPMNHTPSHDMTPMVDIAFDLCVER